MRGVDAVVHMAALLHIVNPPPELREKYEHVNIGGTAMVIDAAIKAGVKRVVLFGTVAVYGDISDNIAPDNLAEIISTPSSPPPDIKAFITLNCY
jgi:UDP-glucose 4-epimerase